ncbi:MAG: DUF3883 domain-containing protein [Chloroflexota bacterium]|nr:DUF3883 domain-containing protein [Chloroflexota bacterium]
MAGKLALKRLTDSDLTFFEYQFRTSSGAKQKAINLNRDVFVDVIYPTLSQPFAPQRFPVDLYLYGPGLMGENNIQRKALKQAKNWRLNAELVHNPTDQPKRYDILEAGDLALFEFGEGVYPNTLRISLLAKALSEDMALHTVLDVILGSLSMVEITSGDLEQAIATANPATEHPIRGFLVGADIEDVALGNSQVRDRIYSNRAHRKMSAQDLERAKRNAERVGQLGEEYVRDYLAGLKDTGQIQDFAWVSASDAVSPYDFWFIQIDGTKRLLDVKATESTFERDIHISASELRQASRGTEEYDIYRLYSITETSAQLRVAENIRDFASDILTVLSNLPQGVSSDAVSVSSRVLPFGEAITIMLADQEDEDRTFA